MSFHDEATEPAPPDADAPKKLSKAERVWRITSIMASGQWVTGKSGTELAKSWGLPEKRIREDAAEASRNVRRSVEDDGTLRAIVILNLQAIAGECRRAKKYRECLEALRLLLLATDPRDPIKIQVQIEHEVEAMLSIAQKALPPDFFRKLLERITEAPVAGAPIREKRLNFSEPAPLLSADTPPEAPPTRHRGFREDYP